MEAVNGGAFGPGPWFFPSARPHRSHASGRGVGGLDGLALRSVASVANEISAEGGVRDALIDIFMAGVRRADPAAAVSAALADGDRPDTIWALGKAAIAMARAARDRWPGVPCLIVTNPENAAEVPGAQVLLGGHPVPDATSTTAGAALLTEADALGQGQTAPRS